MGLNWKHRLFSNIFLRNALATFGARVRLPDGAGEIEPFFQFKIGRYQNDLFLYFLTKPFPLRYKNEIFNKLEEYSGHDVIRYLEFHYCAYEKKSGFLEFLHYEVSERLKQSPKKLSLISTRDWIDQKKVELSSIGKESSLISAKSEDSIILPDSTSEIRDNLNQIISQFRGKFDNEFRELLLKAETSMAALASSYTRGQIELNNRSHEEKLIQLFILIQQIKAPGKAEQLFRKITGTDVAAILHLHFAAFQENKLTTVQRKVSEQTERIRPDQVKIRRLTDALQDFFY